MRFDLAGVSTFSAFLFLTTLALISGNHDGWTSPHILAEGLGAVVFLAIFVTVEKRQARPMVDFSFFRRPTYLGANIAQFTFAAGLLTMLTFMPIYFQHALGLSPRSAGLAMLPLALPLFIVPRIVTSQLSHRVSGRVLLTAGLGLVSAGLGFVALVAGRLDYHLMLAGDAGSRNRRRAVEWRNHQGRHDGDSGRAGRHGVRHFRNHALHRDRARLRRARRGSLQPDLGGHHRGISRTR